ncbi:MFS transporter [Amycolatopsis acidicola]|uniref:Putative proline/betaine transporter n=1 Tax=Amycolatopsis acidicola TaxID=2596893 RepID=A0A5N0VF71_9PSEU|nr:MFS transporter [Amycolatopsis acidicola]KAA9164023.1 MFS transporter [Amycolatopsis acidicola]
MTTYPPDSDRKTLHRAIAAAAIGNFVTWFDFATYGFLALIISEVFFPAGNPALSLLSTFAIFGVAFLMEPVGAFVFGRLGDTMGRKTILATVIIMMSAATFIVGLLPGYAQIGVTAPILLLIVRLLQGFAAGGEPGGAATFLVESAQPERRARTVSVWHCSSYLSNVGASLLILGLYAVLSDEQMHAWGWRVPFLIAAPIGVIGLIIRLKLSDTPEFEKMKSEGSLSESPLREVLTVNRRQVLQVIGCSAFQYAAFYFVFIYMETYLKSELAFSSTAASMSTVACLVIASISIFGFARICDRVGRKPILRWAMIICIVLTFPVFLLINSGSVPLAIVGHVALGVPLAMFMSASGSAMVEIFPARVRYTGFSVGFNVAGALFGGTVAYAATLLISLTGSSLSPSAIIIATALIALVAVATMKETAGPRREVGEGQHREPAAAPAGDTQ